MTSEKIPHSIGIIIDGNRRWAKARGMPSFLGHEAGYRKFKEFIHWAQDAGIRYVTGYAFSTENWNRTAEEVSYLMVLIEKILLHDIAGLKRDQFRIRIIGQRERFSKKIQELMEHAEQETRECTGATVVLALSYGGRAELEQAAEKMCKEGGTLEDHLWTKGMPDPDLIIRTSGEQRLSGFLTWQSVYSELFFLPMMFPDITKEDLERVLREYAERERRNGK